MPGQKRLAGALATVAIAVAISACGSSGDDATIPPESAAQLTSALDGVQSAVNAGDCQEAEQRASDFIDAVNALPDTVGTDDKEALRGAGENLEKLASDPQQCVPDTGTTGLPGQQSTSTTDEETTTSVPTTTATTTSSTTSTTTEEPPPENGGGDEGNGGGESSGGGGETGGGGEVGGGSGGTGGTGTGGTGGGGTG